MAAAGAVVFGLFDTYEQYKRNVGFQCFSLSELFFSSAHGALVGGLFGLGAPAPVVGARMAPAVGMLILGRSAGTRIIGGGAEAAASSASEGIGTEATVSAAPDFVASPGGTIFPVPEGATGPTPVINSAGNQTGSAFTGGSGGANGQVDTMRLMNPTLPRGSSPGYPDGYIKYENASGQGVDPYTGKTLPNSQIHYPH